MRAFRVRPERSVSDVMGMQVSPPLSLPERSLRAASRYFPVAALMLGVIGLFVVYFTGSNWPPIRSDGVGYHSYLPALIIYGDPQFEEIPRVFAKYYKASGPGEFSTWSGIRFNPETGHYFNKYPIGVSVMLSPLFIVAHGLAHLFEQPADGFSPLYQFIMILGGLAYGALALAELQRMLEQEFGPGPTFAALVSILFGTNLFHYMTYDNMMSHIYSFALVVLLMASLQWWRRFPGLQSAAAVGVVVGFIALVRLPNLIFVLLGPFYGMFGESTRGDPIRRWVTRPACIAGALTASILVFLPQVAYWKFATGSFHPPGYPGETFDFLHPEILNVLFSARKGLFFWSPILLLGVFGVLTPQFRRTGLLVPAVLIVILQVYIAASWWCWWFGGSYGHRGFVETLPLFAFVLAAFFASLPNRWARLGVGIVCALMILLCLIQMVQYWKKILPFDGMNWELYKQAFLQWER